MILVMVEKSGQRTAELYLR